MTDTRTPTSREVIEFRYYIYDMEPRLIGVSIQTCRDALIQAGPNWDNAIEHMRLLS